MANHELMRLFSYLTTSSKRPTPPPPPPTKFVLSLGSRESVILYLGIEAGRRNPDPVEAVQREGHQVLIPFTASAANTQGSLKLAARQSHERTNFIYDK
jgi:hypothetical protein